MTDATNMNGPLTPDWSYDCNQVELLDKIQALETTTPAVSINNFSVLQEKHSKDEQDASVHGKLLLDVQTNLRTEMQLRAETEEKLSQGHCASQQSTIANNHTRALSAHGGIGRVQGICREA